MSTTTNTLLSAEVTSTAVDFAETAQPPAAGPSRPTKRQQPSMRSRVANMFHRLTERPSLLSSTSDSAETGEDDEWERYHSSTAGRDPRLYRMKPKRFRGRHRRGTESQTQSQGQTGTMDDGAEVDFDADAEKQDDQGGVTSKVVVDSDFSTWIDPTTGRLVDSHTDTEDDGGSVRTGHSATEATETSQHARIQKAAENLHVPWLAGFIENVRYFFDMSFPDKSKERAYLKDVYFVRRQIALSASTFFVVMWILVCATTPKPYDLYDYYAYIGIYGALTLPLFPIIYFNANYHMPISYQLWLTLATWVLPDITVIKVKTCGVWEPGVTCDTRSFFIAFAAAIGQPVLALLSLNQNRLCAVIGAGQFFVMIAIFYFHQTTTPSSFYRDAVYYIVFHVIILIIDAFLERRDRQMFELREQLKAQFRATQRAQLAEKRAADLKKRFASYIFHEVRVPLNTACLAVQNLEDEGVFKGIQDEQREMVHGLSGSLSLMEKVLNDVLSFNRMETGKFAQAKVPFDFHRSIELTALSHSATAHAKGLDLNTELDRRVDQLGCAFIGDEMRLRQVTSNLVSNSLKFTVSGSVTLRTKLLLPTIAPPERSVSPPSRVNGHPAGMPDVFAADIEKGSPENGHGTTDRSPSPRPRATMAIVRIEIADTGVGLRHQDMVENRLFSPYVQTEIGRRQGGKGTGLGLALVRQIVELNKGRLGVDSEYGKGSTFWLELPYKLKRGSVSEPTKDGSVPSSKTCVDPIRNSSTDPILPSATNILVEDPASLPPESSGRTRVASDATAEDTCPRSPATHMPSPSPITPSTSQCIQGRQSDRPLNALVVDDDPLTRKMMVRMIQRLGHRANTAEHGKEGLERIDSAYHLQSGSSPVDVVFLDNQMPFMSGVEVSRTVRETGNPVYIVGCTGNALREDQDEYLDAGADKVLTKPIKQAAIVEALALARTRLEGQIVPRGFQTKLGHPTPRPVREDGHDAQRDATPHPRHKTV